LQTDPAQNIKINKAKSSEKVDGMVALVMALGEMMTDENPGESIYNDRGILSF
jgi:phage terminase large subunit-like protein